jgi:hypothetical protein
MKLQLTAYNKTYTVETETDDYNINEYLEIIVGLLFQTGFYKETIDRGIIELAEQLKGE